MLPFFRSGIGVRFKRLVVPLLAIASSACDDGFGPQFWDPTPDTILIYSVSRPELLGYPSAFDAVSLRRIPVEAPTSTGTWDFLLAEQNGGFVMVPAGAVGGVVSRAGIARVDADSLGGIREAPSDTARFSSAAVAIEPGAFYVLRTRRDACLGFGAGVRYAKLHALTVDAVAGTYRFAVVRNPFCNDRALIPPEDEG